MSCWFLALGWVRMTIDGFQQNTSWLSGQFLKRLLRHKDQLITRTGRLDQCLKQKSLIDPALHLCIFYPANSTCRIITMFCLGEQEGQNWSAVNRGTWDWKAVLLAKWLNAPMITWTSFHKKTKHKMEIIYVTQPIFSPSANLDETITHKRCDSDSEPITAKYTARGFSWWLSNVRPVSKLKKQKTYLLPIIKAAWMKHVCFLRVEEQLDSCTN